METGSVFHLPFINFKGVKDSLLEQHVAGHTVHHTHIPYTPSAI